MVLIKFTALLFIGVAIRGSFADEPEQIVGGRTAYEGEFPYYASLRYHGRHFCGGTIISKSHILTAYHCADKIMFPYTDFTVVTGSVRMLGGQIHHLKNITKHPNFIEKEDMSLVNDLAIITLERPIVVDNLQRPIRIASTETLPGSVAVMAGFGRRYTNGPNPELLVTASVFVLPTNECQMLLDPHIYLTHLCTISSGRDGSCNGDSGGPVVYGNELIGVISWTQGRCEDGNPDVSTKVMYYDTFITDAINSQV